MVNSHVSLPSSSAAASNNTSSAASQLSKSKRDSSTEKRPASRQSLDPSDTATMSSSANAGPPVISTGRRESRHVHVVGLPEGLNNDRVMNFFSAFGRVQKVDRSAANPGGVVVSFMDVGAARKARSSDVKFEGYSLRMAFYDQAKNGILGNSSSSTSQNRSSSPPLHKTLASVVVVADQKSKQRQSSDPKMRKRKSQENASSGTVTANCSTAPSSSAKISTLHTSRSSTSSTKHHERSEKERHEKRRIEPEKSRRVKRASASSGSSTYSSNSPSPSPRPPSRSARKRIPESSHETRPSKGPSPTVSSVSDSAQSSGLQGIHVSQLPSTSTLSEKAQRDQLAEVVRKHAKLIDISFEPLPTSTTPSNGSGTLEVTGNKALLLLQRVSEMDALLAEINQLVMAGSKLKATKANYVVVTEAHNAYLAANSATASGLGTASFTAPSNTNNSNANSERSSSSSSAKQTSNRDYKVLDPFAKSASRTMYVGGLECRITEDNLRSRFDRFGQILEIEIKNRESPSPYAFIHFNDVNSVVKAAQEYWNNREAFGRNRLKLNFGHSRPSNKLWLGSLPNSCHEDYIKSKLSRVIPAEQILEINYDSKFHEALVLFKTIESTATILGAVKSATISFTSDRSDPEASPYVQVDYCCDRLHNYFTDRKFGRNAGISSHRSSSNRVKSWTEATSNTPTSTNVVSSSTGSRLDTSSEQTSSQLLPKPPEPPALPAFTNAPLTRQPSNPENQMTSKTYNSKHVSQTSPDSSRSRKEAKPRERDQASTSFSHNDRRALSRHTSHDSRQNENRNRPKPKQKVRHRDRSRSSSSSVSSSTSSRSSSTSSSSESEVDKKNVRKGREGRRKQMERNKKEGHKDVRHKDSKSSIESRKHQRAVVVGKQPITPPSYGLPSTSFDIPVAPPTGYQEPGVNYSGNDTRIHTLSPPPPMPQFEAVMTRQSSSGSSSTYPSSSRERRRYSKKSRKDSSSSSSSEDESLVRSAKATETPKGEPLVSPVPRIVPPPNPGFGLDATKQSYSMPKIHVANPPVPKPDLPLIHTPKISIDATKKPQFSDPTRPRELVKHPINIPYLPVPNVSHDDPRPYVNYETKSLQLAEQAFPLPKFASSPVIQQEIKARRLSTTSFPGMDSSFSSDLSTPTPTKLKNASHFEGDFGAHFENETSSFHAVLSRTASNSSGGGVEKTTGLISPSETSLTTPLLTDKDLCALDQDAQGSQNQGSATSSLAERINAFGRQFDEFYQRSKLTSLTSVPPSRSTNSTFNIQQELERLKAKALPTTTASSVSSNTVLSSTKPPEGTSFARKTLTIQIPPVESSVSSLAKMESPTVSSSSSPRLINRRPLMPDQFIEAKEEFVEDKKAIDTTIPRSAPPFSTQQDVNVPVIKEEPLDLLSSLPKEGLSSQQKLSEKISAIKTEAPAKSPVVKTPQSSETESSRASAASSITPKPMEAKKVFTPQTARPTPPTPLSRIPVDPRIKKPATPGSPKTTTITKPKPATPATPLTASSTKSTSHPLTQEAIQKQRLKQQQSQKNVLEDLFRQQANDSSKRFSAIPKIEKKPSTSSTLSAPSKEQIKESVVPSPSIEKRPSISNLSVTSDKNKDERKVAQPPGILKEKIRPKEERDKPAKDVSEKKMEIKPIMKPPKPQPQLQGLSRSDSNKGITEKDREKLKEKKEKKEAFKKNEQKKEEIKKQEQQKQEKKEEKKKPVVKKKKFGSDSDSEASDGSTDSISALGLKGIDLEMQRILFEEAAAGGSLTMYDRVKRRAAATKPEEQKKKTDALEIIREKKQVNKKPQRIQLSSSEGDSDADKDSSDKASTSKTIHEKETTTHETDEDSDAGTSVTSRSTTVLAQKKESPLPQPKEKPKPTKPKTAPMKTMENVAPTKAKTEIKKSPVVTNKKPSQLLSSSDSDSSSSSEEDTSESEPEIKQVKQLRKALTGQVSSSSDSDDSSQASKSIASKKSKTKSTSKPPPKSNISMDDVFGADSSDDNNSNTTFNFFDTKKETKKMLNEKKTKAGRPKKSDTPTKAPDSSKKADEKVEKKKKQAKKEAETEKKDMTTPKKGPKPKNVEPSAQSKESAKKAKASEASTPSKKRKLADSQENLAKKSKEELKVEAKESQKRMADTSIDNENVPKRSKVEEKLKVAKKEVTPLQEQKHKTSELKIETDELQSLTKENELKSPTKSTTSEKDAIAEAPIHDETQIEARSSLQSTENQRARTVSTSSNASSSSTASITSSSSHENELLTAMQSQEPQVMDIAASHLPDPEPYVEPAKPKPVEEVPPAKSALNQLSRMKFVAASKEAGRTSSVDENPAIPIVSHETLEVVESGKIVQPKIISAEVVDSGKVMNSGKVAIVEKVIDSGKVLVPPRTVMTEPPKLETKPVVNEEAERLRKMREKEVAADLEQEAEQAVQAITLLMEGSGQSNSEDEDQFTSNLLPLAKRPSDASQSGDDSMGVPTMNIASPKGFVTHEISASLYNEKEARAQNSIKEQIAKPHSVSSTEHDISNLEPTLFKANVVPQQPPQVQNAYDNGIITEMASSQAPQRQNSLHNSSPYQQQQAGYPTASQPFYPQAQPSQQPTSQVQDNRPVQSQFSSVVQQQPSQVPTDVIASTASPAINPTIQQQVRPLVGNTTAGNVFPASEYERNMLNFMNHPQAILMQQHLGMYTARTMAPNVSTPWSTFMPQQAATTQLQIPTTLVNHNSAVDLQRQQQLQAQQAAAAKNLTTPVNVQPTAQMFQQQALQPIQINQQPTLMNQQPQQMLQNAPRATQPSPQRDSLTPHIFSSQQAVPRVNSPMVTRSPQPNMMAGQHSYQQGGVPMQQNLTQPVPVVQSPHMQYARTTEMVNASPMGYNHSPQPPAPHVKYPVLWEGQLVMKNTDTLVQMHKVFGDVKWMEKCNQEMVLRHNGIAAIRITQRMRLEPTQLEGVLRKMECPDDFIAFVCLPCGRSMEDIKRNMKTLNEAFIEYFTSKQAAGIANTGTVPNPSCVVHVFPPGDFTTNHLRRYAPDLLETVEQRKAGYLFVVITANTLNL